MGKTLGEMTPEERRAVTERALAQFQAELTRAAPGISRMLDEADKDLEDAAVLRSAAAIMKSRFGVIATERDRAALEHAAAMIEGGGAPLRPRDESSRD